MTNPFTPPEPHHDGGFTPPPSQPGPVSSSGAPFSLPSDSQSTGVPAFGVPDGSSQSSFPQPGSTSALSASAGPWLPALGAALTAVAGIVFTIITGVTSTSTESAWLWLSLTAWFLAGVLTFILLGFYTLIDTRRQAESFYISNTLQTFVVRAALGLGVIGVIVSAIQIAFWFGKAFGG
ncbi:hypothetical protein QP027_11065 [Corynebacterium breve]|uniref:Uncharacterized protein n=1 Tax=Corynebacterium breve TaxID=3049799 RepID=A0ABY8VHA8_9CORY|nr:hypothetical protein [Corynebacterium breve]WIM67609.1 hypothetical protein QP027_11065 [Corynebacterium breve]